MANRPTQSGGTFMLIMAILLGGIVGAALLGGLMFIVAVQSLPTSDSENTAALITCGIFCVIGFIAGAAITGTIWKKSRETG
jgi:tetrahydromethanopterin S-methyltransferase subunit D